MNTLFKILENFKNSSVLVIGDIMLDSFNYGTVERISPEAPIPVLRLKEKYEMLGGAGNVVANINSLESNSGIITVVGEDENSRLISNQLSSLNCDFFALGKKDVPTITKTRFISGNQQILRADLEETFNLSQEDENLIIDEVSKRISKYDIIVLSDYKKGVLTENICRSIISMANSNQKSIFVDPKGKNYGIYSHATLIKPNQKELCDAFGDQNVLGNETLYARKLIEEYHFKYCIVTLGENGMLLVSKDKEQHFHSIKREVFDVSGAGDTVIATLASSYASGATIEDACILANIAGGLVVSKVGTATINPFEIQREIGSNNKIYSSKELLTQINLWKRSNLKIGFTNGCFDILHAGHIQTLNFARNNCDRLIVALNTDKSVKSLKGPERPINNEQERAIVLSELESIDALIFFDDNTPEKLIKNIKPDVLVKGGDYNAREIVGYDFINSYGGKVIIAPFSKGLSTTNIVKKIKT